MFVTVTVGDMVKVTGPENSRSLMPPRVTFWFTVMLFPTAFAPVRALAELRVIALAGALSGSPMVKVPVPRALLPPRIRFREVM